MDPKERALMNVVDAKNAASAAKKQYKLSLERYVEVGGSYAELGRLLGVSRQAVRQFVEGGREK